MIRIVQGDITTLAVDAIVNAANQMMLGGGGVDGAIPRAAGPELYEACLAVPDVRPGVRCPTGEARITPGFRLPLHLHRRVRLSHRAGDITPKEKVLSTPTRLGRIYRVNGSNP